MSRLLLPTVTALLVTPAFGQTDDKFHMPTTLGSYEGDTFNDQVFNQPYMRWQQAVSDSASSFHPVNWLRLRRDGLRDTPLATGRTVEVRIHIGQKNPPVFVPPVFPLTGPFGNNFLANYAGGAQGRTLYFFRKNVNLPDWTQLPAKTPAPFEPTGTPPGLEFPVDAGVFYLYTGTPELIIELEVWNPSGGGHAVDATTGNGTFLSSACTTGPGCGNFSHQFDYQVTNWGPTATMNIGVTSGPAVAPVVFMLGAFDPNQAIPGVCGNLRNTLSLVSVVGTTDASGNFSRPFSQRFQRRIGGARFFTQCGSIDPTTLQVRLTNGLADVLPLVPAPLRASAGKEGFLVQHVWSTSEGAATGTGPVQGALIWQLQDF